MSIDRFKETLSTISHGLREGTFEFVNNYRFSLSGLGLGLAKYEYFLIVPLALDCIQLAEVHLEFHTFSPQLGYILLSINSKPLMILGIT